MTSRLFLKLAQPWFRLRRGMTLGVRAAILDPQRGVLLVRHSYAPGWLFPGGGVERGETIHQAVEREIREEAGIVMTGKPHFHGLLSNEEKFPGDHIACFVIREFREQPHKADFEIREARFFPLDQLPEGTTGGTRRRIAEIVNGQDAAPLW
jgi:8-oxo-dGTP pyrophosphatase MutT (NUDIX family)